MPQNRYCPHYVPKSATANWLFSSPHYTFFVFFFFVFFGALVMSPLFFEMDFTLLHALSCEPCNLFCTTNDLFKRPIFCCVPSKSCCEISIYFLLLKKSKVLFWGYFIFYHKRGEDFQMVIFKIGNWINKNQVWLLSISLFFNFLLMTR